MASPFEIGVSVITLIHLAAKILDVTTKFTAEVKTAPGRNSDLISQVSLLRDILPPVARTLDLRQTHIAQIPISPDEQDLLNTISNVVDRLKRTVRLFAEKVEKLGGAPGRWQDVMLQLKLMKSGSDIASLENRISSEVASLQLMMTCYSWYDKSIKNELTPELPADDAMTSLILTDIHEYMSSFREDVNRLTAKLGVDPTDEKEPAKDGLSDLKMMLNCYEAAKTCKSTIETLSRSGSVVAKERRSEQSETLLDDNPDCYDYELQTELIRVCRQRGGHFLKDKDYNMAGFYLRRAIDEARKRNKVHGTPFDERFEFETTLAKAYLGLEDFDLANETLEALKPVAKASPLWHAELWYLLACLYRRQYETTKDHRRLDEWDQNALVAYNLARKLSLDQDDFEGSNLLLDSAKLMIEAHEAKGDDIVSEYLIGRHPEVDPARDNTMLSPYPDDGRGGSASSCPSQPSTPLSLSPSRTDSVVSEPAPPPPPPPPISNNISARRLTLDLINAITEENIEAVEELVARDPWITRDTDEKGRTPLMYAIISNDMSTVMKLIHHSPVRVKDKDGKTAFHHAVFGHTRKEMVKAIIGHREVTPALLDAVDSLGQTALHQCVAYQQIFPARHLIAHGASLDIKDRLGDTPMALAKQQNFKDLFNQARTLIESGRFATMSTDGRFKCLGGVSQPARLSTSSGSPASVHDRKSSKSSGTRREGSISTGGSSTPSTKLTKFGIGNFLSRKK